MNRSCSALASTVATSHTRPSPNLAMSLLGSLPDDLGGGFVVAQPEKARLAQPIIAGPLGEADLRDQLGRVHRAPRGIGRPSTNGDSGEASCRNWSPSSRSVAALKPVPTFPAYLSSPSS